MNAKLKKAYHFFLENDGYCTPPGRAACALESARVDVLRGKLEADGRIEFRWETDTAADRGPRDWGWSEKEIGDFYDKPHDVEGCVLVVDGEETESLWGIWDASPEYRRCVEKDLLSQYISTQGTTAVHLGQSCYGPAQRSLDHMLTA